MKIHATFMLVLIAAGTLAHADTYVNGYYRKNGTYVQPHYRSDSNNTKLDNWSTRGNVNPYTGSAGTKDPYSGTSTSNSFGNSKDTYKRSGHSGW